MSSDITHILDAIDAGDPRAAERLLPLVYDELRRLAAAQMAHEKPGQTLDATGLVHEAYLRLIQPLAASRSDGASATPQAAWANRRHFFAAAAEAMRRILVDAARRKQAHKHGGAFVRGDVDPDQLPIAGPDNPLELLAIHEALDLLATKSPRRAELVKLRYFLGCTIPEAARMLGIAPATAEEDWTYARAWLRRQLSRGEEKNRSS